MFNGKGKRNLIIWVVLFFVIISLSNFLFDPVGNKQKLAFSDFISKVNKGEVKSVQIKGKDLYGKTKNDKEFYTYLPEYPGLVDKLGENKVDIEVLPLVSKSEKFVGGLIGWLPFIILIGLWVMFARGMASGGNKALGFGKSKAKLLHENKAKVLFSDVAGIDEAKNEVEEVVDFLKDPKKYTQIGARIPRGCLLIGPPGTGKTLLARAIAGEAGVPFFSISGSDFVEMFVGVGASRVRDMFEQAKKSSPCIIFIDEIDAVGRHRGSGIGGGNDEREQTLNQLLVEMDGFSDNEGVIVVAATNRPDVLDRALLRPGRFDRQITVPNPDINGREQILKVHMKKVSAASDIDVNSLARGTPGFAGADLANLVNEAALISAKRNYKIITMHILEEAKDKILMGPERKSMIMQQEEKELTAYHEAGHAITAVNCPSSDPIHKATIIPRGRALGLVMRLPERDRFSVTREKLLDDLVVALGGRAAEELIFGYDKVTTGASSDIMQATQIARNMVTSWGLSDKVGAIDYSKDQERGYMQSSSDNFSEETAKTIDLEVKRIIDEALDRARTILKEKRDDLELLARNLLKYETLSGEEIKHLLEGKLIRVASNDGSDSPKSFLPSFSE